jgi:transposase
MEYFAGIDVSLKESSVCLMDASGKIVQEAKVASEPEVVVGFLREQGDAAEPRGFGSRSAVAMAACWPVSAGFDAVLLETRHVKVALSAMVVKTDRKDARGIAQLLRMGWYRPVHCKSLRSQELRALLTGRKLLLSKVTDVELGIRGVLRGFGLKVGAVSKGRFAARIRELIAGQYLLESVIEPMLRARQTLREEVDRLHRQVLEIVRDDAVCRRLMTVPGVGAVVALSFKSAVDDPGRFRSSKTVGAYFGLTPKKYQSGESDVSGRISKVGDGMVRTALYEAAQVMLTRSARHSAVNGWAMQVAKRRGRKRAIVALARKLATVLHRLWVDGSEFRCGRERGLAAA